MLNYWFVNRFIIRQVTDDNLEKVKLTCRQSPASHYYAKHILEEWDGPEEPERVFYLDMELNRSIELTTQELAEEIVRDRRDGKKLINSEKPLVARKSNTLPTIRILDTQISYPR